MSKQLKKVLVPATLAAVVGGALYDMDSFYVHADGMTTVVDGGRDLVEKDVHVNGSAQTIYVNYRYNRPDGEHWSTGTANVIGNKTLVTAAHLFLDWNYDKLSAITGVDFYIGANGAAVTNGVPSGDYKKITMTGDEFRKAVHFYNKDGFLKPREKIMQLIDGQPDTTYSMASNAYDLAAITLPDVFAFKSKEAGLGLSDPMRLTSSYELPKKGDTISYVGYPGTGKGMEKQLANGLFKQGRQYGTNGPAVSILTKDLGGDTHAFDSDGLYDPESSSSLGRLADKDAKNHLHDFGNLDAPLLQIKMTSIPGVSGSALKNSKGEVISVISGMTTRPSTYGTLFDNKRLDWLRSIIKADTVTGLQTDKDGSRYVFDDNGFLVRNGKKRIGDYEFTTNADGKVVAERNAKADEDKAKAEAEKAAKEKAEKEAKEKAEKEKVDKEKADKEKADKEKAEKEKAEAEANKKTYAYAINVTVIDDATGQKAFEHANPMATDSSKEVYEKALVKILDPIKDRLDGGSQKGVPFYALFDDVYTNKATSEAAKGPFIFVNYKVNENTRVEGNKTMQRATVEVHVTSKVAETKPVETKSVETKPVETKPVETKPVETKPVETKPVETKPAKVHYQLDIAIVDDATGKTIKTKTVTGDSETENRYQSILTAQKNGFDAYLTNGKYEGLPVSIGENADGLTYSYQSGNYQPVSSKLSEGVRTENNVMTRTGKLELHVTSQLPQDEVINVTSKDGHTLKTLTKQDLGGRSVADVIGAIRDGKGNDILPNVTLSANAKPVNVVSNGKTVKTWTVVVESGVVAPVESTKPVETKPVETKPVETKPVDTKPVETKPVETKPVETKPVETKPVETKPVETKPVETKPVETKPVETKPVETKPVETKPVETKPVEIKPVETKPVVPADRPGNEPAPKVTNYDVAVSVIDDATGKVLSKKVLDGTGEDAYKKTLSDASATINAYLKNGRYEGLSVTPKDNALGFDTVEKASDKAYEAVSSKTSEGTRLTGTITTKSATVEFHVTSQLPYQDEVIDVVTDKGKAVGTVTANNLKGVSVASVIRLGRDTHRLSNTSFGDVTVLRIDKPVYMTTNGKTVKKWTVVVSDSVKPVETKPVETKPVETKPVETKPVEIKPVETKPVETKPVETKPVETKPVETKPVETKPVETKPVETKPVETKPVETKPVETKPVETKPVETKSVETKPVETKPVETKPVEIKPVETKPVETKPVETKPVETKPVETKPVETKPVEIKPVETKPSDSFEAERQAQKAHLAEEARLAAVAVGLIKEGEAFNKEQAAYAESIRQNAQAEYARLSAEKEKEDAEKQSAKVAADNKRQWFKKEADTILSQLDDVLKALDRQSDDIAKTLKERFGVSTPSVNKVVKIDDVTKVNSVSKVDDVTKVDTATKVDDVTNVDTVTPKGNGVVTKVATVTPEGDNVTKVDTVTSKGNDVAKVDKVIPKVDKVISEVDKITPKGDSVTKVDTITSKVDSVTSKGNTVTPKSNNVTSKSDTVTKVDVVTSNDNTVTPKGDSVTKDTGITSDGAVKRDNTIKNDSKTTKPTTNTELPDAGDSLVARLSALPVIGLGFGLLLRRRDREE